MRQTRKGRKTRNGKQKKRKQQKYVIQVIKFFTGSVAMGPTSFPSAD
jgi:hypothetical protein